MPTRTEFGWGKDETLAAEFNVTEGEASSELSELTDRNRI
jgi:hypothetical protein